MNSRQAWIAGVGGVVGFALILVGALWTMPSGLCSDTCGDDDYDCIGRGRCIAYEPDLTWLNPTLLIAGVVVLITAAVLAFSPWGRREG